MPSIKSDTVLENQNPDVNPWDKPSRAYKAFHWLHVNSRKHRARICYLAFGIAAGWNIIDQQDTNDAVIKSLTNNITAQYNQKGYVVEHKLKPAKAMSDTVRVGDVALESMEVEEKVSFAQASKDLVEARKENEPSPLWHGIVNGFTIGAIAYGGLTALNAMMFIAEAVSLTSRRIKSEKWQEDNIPTYG